MSANPSRPRPPWTALTATTVASTTACMCIPKITTMRCGRHRKLRHRKLLFSTSCRPSMPLLLTKSNGMGFPITTNNVVVQPKEFPTTPLLLVVQPQECSTTPLLLVVVQPKEFHWVVGDVKRLLPPPPTYPKGINIIPKGINIIANL